MKYAQVVFLMEFKVGQDSGKGREFESHCYQKRKWDIGIVPCTEGVLMVQQDLSGRPAIIKAELDL